jgi:tRNA nucleotidyltransferase/poly(A) polymerase
MNISKIILTDPVNKWVFANAKAEVFLVGGYIRDLIRGEVSKDKDFVLKNKVKETAFEFAKNVDGTFIVLKKNQTYRVVLRNGCFIDFTLLKKDIEEDLRKRDFTINAIAWSPGAGIIDPFEGSKDLIKGEIKPVRSENIGEDPLRVLRAYRLSCQLKLNINNNTRKILRNHSSELKKIAPERITEELFKILNKPVANEYLKLCLKDYVLNQVINIKMSILKENINLIERFDILMNLLSKKIYGTPVNNKILPLLNNEFSQGLTREGFVRLSLLLLNHTYSGLSMDRETSESIILDKMKYLRASNRIINSIKDIHNALTLAKGNITNKKLFDIFRSSINNVYEVALILCLLKPKSKKRLLKKAEDFMQIKKIKILSGYEIQKLLKIPPGTLIGALQDKILEKQFYGVIKNKNEARSWILYNLT